MLLIKNIYSKIRISNLTVKRFHKSNLDSTPKAFSRRIGIQNVSMKIKQVNNSGIFFKKNLTIKL